MSLALRLNANHMRKLKFQKKNFFGLMTTAYIISSYIHIVISNNFFCYSYYERKRKNYCLIFVCVFSIVEDYKGQFCNT